MFTRNVGAMTALSATMLYYWSYEHKQSKWYPNTLNTKWFNTVSNKLSTSIMGSYKVNWYALTQQQRAKLMSKPTDVYVWGNGLAIDASLDYSNYYPKKIKNFSGENTPQIIIVKFGEFHEAYLDKQGKIHICKKHKLPSMKLESNDDWLREDMVTLEIKGRQITDMAFTQNRLFVLTNKKEVYVWKIQYYLPDSNEEEKDYFNHDTDDFVVEIVKEPVHIKELSNIEEIASGTDHFIARDANGDVWAMGDDTFGQCGQYGDNRPEIPPFKERRAGKPVKVKLQTKATKIGSGFRHSFAINSAGELFWWGYNNQQQLSHSEEFATETSMKHVIFEPAKITREIENKRTVLATGGKDFSLFVTEDRNGVQEVFSTGNNLRGQLGINRISHLQDVLRLDDVSGFVDSSRNKPLKVSHVACGRRHSVLVFDYGAFFIWGDNEKGQMGDRTRRMIESPFPKAKFELKHNVLNVEAGFDNCAIIVERLPEDIRDKDDEDEKRKKRKPKRQAKQIQNLPKPIVKEPEQPSLYQRVKDKISRLLKRRQEEVEKMKAIKERANAQKQQKEKSEEQLLFEEVAKEQDKSDKHENK